MRVVLEGMNLGNSGGTAGTISAQKILGLFAELLQAGVRRQAAC
jgi:hypothetical protein